MQHFDAFVFIFELMNDISLWIAIQPHIIHTALKIQKVVQWWLDWLVLACIMYIKIFFYNIWSPGFDKRKPIPPNWEKAWACYVHYVCYYTIEILIIWISCIQNTWIYCSTRDSIAASRAKPECCNTVPSAAINPSILNKWNSNYKYIYFVSFY